MRRDELTVVGERRQLPVQQLHLRPCLGLGAFGGGQRPPELVQLLLQRTDASSPGRLPGAGADELGGVLRARPVQHPRPPPAVLGHAQRGRPRRRPVGQRYGRQEAPHQLLGHRAVRVDGRDQHLGQGAAAVGRRVLRFGGGPRRRQQGPHHRVRRTGVHGNPRGEQPAGGEGGLQPGAGRGSHLRPEVDQFREGGTRWGGVRVRGARRPALFPTPQRRQLGVAPVDLAPDLGHRVLGLDGRLRRGLPRRREPEAGVFRRGPRPVPHRPQVFGLHQFEHGGVRLSSTRERDGLGEPAQRPFPPQLRRLHQPLLGLVAAAGGLGRRHLGGAGVPGRVLDPGRLLVEGHGLPVQRRHQRGPAATRTSDLIGAPGRRAEPGRQLLGVDDGRQPAFHHHRLRVRVGLGQDGLLAHRDACRGQAGHPGAHLGVEAGVPQAGPGRAGQLGRRVPVLGEPTCRGQHRVDRPVLLGALPSGTLQRGLGGPTRRGHQCLPVAEITQALVAGQRHLGRDRRLQLAFPVLGRGHPGRGEGTLLVGLVPLLGEPPDLGTQRRQGAVGRGHPLAQAQQGTPHVAGVGGDERSQRVVRGAQPRDVLPDRLQVVEGGGEVVDHGRVERGERVGQDLLQLPLQHLQPDVGVAQGALEVQEVRVPRGGHLVDEVGDAGPEPGIVQHPVRPEGLPQLRRAERDLVGAHQPQLETHPTGGDEPPRVGDLLRGLRRLDPQAAGQELGADGSAANQLHPRVADPVRPALVVVEHQPPHADGVETLRPQLPEITVEAERQQQLQRPRLPRPVGALEDGAATGEVEGLLGVLPDVDDPASVEPPAVGLAHC